MSLCLKSYNDGSSRSPKTPRHQQKTTMPPRALRRDQIYSQMIAEMAKKHSSKAFYTLDDPLEAAMHSVLIDILKEWDRAIKS